MENELEQQDAQNLEEVIDEPQAEESAESSELSVEEQLEQARKQASEYKAKMKHWRDKAQKKEEPVSSSKESPAKVDSSGLSTEDVLALVEAKVPKADIPAIKDAAKALGLSVSDALDSPVVKAILKTNAEERLSAEASNTGGSKRSVTKLSDESIVEMAVKSPDKVDPAEYAAAQLRLRRKEAGLE